MSLFAFDHSFLSQGFSSIAGVDEVGRGCLAGPVVAACVCFRDAIIIEGIRDSKELTSQERERLFEEIGKHAYVGVGIVDVETIDRVNILQATLLAMKRACEELGTHPELILVDALQIPDIKTSQRAIIKGDKKSASIASASIVAKVVRDRIMVEYHEKYPQYGFDRHKGYATKEHIEALKKYGPSPIHRKSFSPVQKLMLF